jgi:hypothetical protein
MKESHIEGVAIHDGERLAKFRLELHPDKTRLRFGRFAAPQRKEKGESGCTADLQLPRVHALLQSLEEWVGPDERGLRSARHVGHGQPARECLQH